MNKGLVQIMIISLLALCLCVPVQAATQTKTLAVAADKDTYVQDYYATSNYGGKDWLIFGDYILGYAETYIHFSFADRPSGWTKAVITIDCYSVSETFKAAACLVEADWEELTMTWLNKPASSSVIETLTLSAGDEYSIDVTNYITGNGISICLKVSDYSQTGYVQARSREGGDIDSSYFPPPKLTWTYEESHNTSIPGFNPLIISLLLISMSALLMKAMKKRVKQ